MKNTPRDLYLAQKRVKHSIKTIPKKNKHKFAVDLLKLIEKAHEGNYENFNFE